MATRKRLTLDVWIHNAMSDEKDNRKCSMIALVHTVGAQQKEIHHVKFASGKNPTPEELANIFRQRAEGYAQDLSGTQTFLLLAFYGKSEPETSQPFTVSPIIDHQNPIPSEPATSEGRVQQLMRQGEMLFQQVYRRQQVMDEHANNMIDRQSRMMVDLMAQNRAFFDMTKELLMEKALDTHKHRMDELGYSRASEERKKWISYIPMLINTLTGKDIFPQSTADTVLLEQIVENVDENAIAMLSHVLKPELVGPVMERFTQIQQKKRLEKEATVKALTAPIGLSGEEDAGGGKDE